MRIRATGGSQLVPDRAGPAGISPPVCGGRGLGLEISGVIVAGGVSGVRVWVIEGVAVGADVSLAGRRVSLGAADVSCGVAVSLEVDGTVASCVSTGEVAVPRRVLVGTGEFTGAMVWVGCAAVEDGAEVGGSRVGEGPMVGTVWKAGAPQVCRYGTVKPRISVMVAMITSLMWGLPFILVSFHADAVQVA